MWYVMRVTICRMLDTRETSAVGAADDGTIHVYEYSIYKTKRRIKTNENRRGDTQ